MNLRVAEVNRPVVLSEVVMLLIGGLKGIKLVPLGVPIMGFCTFRRCKIQQGGASDILEALRVINNRNGSHSMASFTENEKSRALTLANLKVPAILQVHRSYIDRAEEHARAFAEALATVWVIRDADKNRIYTDADQTAQARE